MKKLFLLAIAGYALPATASDTVALRRYYESVHQATVHICKGELRQAAPLYEQAFSLTRYPFFTDINNALYTQVYAPAPDTIKIARYLKILQQMGICVHRNYERYPSFKPYLSLANEADCNKVLRPALRAPINRALDKDQAIRETRDRTLYNRVDIANFRIVDSAFRQAELENIPMEYYIGFTSNGSCFTILNHNASIGVHNKFLVEKLCRKGILDNRLVASQLDYYYDRGNIKISDSVNTLQQAGCGQFNLYGSSVLTISMNKAFIKIPSTVCLEEINRIRQRLYLQDVLEQAKIIVFAAGRFKSGFTYPGLMFVSLPPEHMDALERKAKEHYKVIVYNWRTDFDFNRQPQ